MSSKRQNKIRNILLTILPGLIITGLVWAANIYYDLDLPKVIVNWQEIQNSEVKPQNYNSKLKINYVQIKDTKDEEYVLSLNEKTGKIVPAKIKALLDKEVQPIYELATEDDRTIRPTGNHHYLVKSVSNLPMLNMNNFNGLGISEQEFYSVISNSQPEFFPSFSSKFFDFSVLKGMIEPANFFELGNNSFLNLNRYPSQFFFCSGMEEAFEHKDKNYLADFTRCLTRLSTSSIGIQDFFRLASLTRFSVSIIASGVDHSIKSIISSNSFLERTFGGANTPRRYFSSMMVRDDDLFIHNHDNKEQDNLSNTKWVIGFRT